MKKQQAIVVCSGILLLVFLYFFGKTVPSRHNDIKPTANNQAEQAFDIKKALLSAKNDLSPARQAYVNSLESSIVRGDVKQQQVHVYHQLAAFWKDSVRSFEPYAFYTAEASKLENSEKSLTFAAQLFLDNLRGGNDPSIKTWMAEQARVLFERSLQLNPYNDSARIGLGSSYIFGGDSDHPQELMKGVQQILQVARRDSTNMYAQLMLGIGGVVSGQFDKAIERLIKVVNNQPNNLEAILTLAEAYERKGDKINALKWYDASKRLIANPEVIKEINERINSLK